MRAIIPAILPRSREDLDQKLALLSGITNDVQIDVVDGRFVSPASWPYLHEGMAGASTLNEDDELPELGSFKFDLDLMVEEPVKAIDRWIKAGATRITVHAETAHRLSEIIENFQHKYGHDKGFAPELLSFGLAVNVATDTSLIEPFIDQCDYIQFMGIARIGKQGEPFDMRVIPKIHAFHRKYPDMPIQVDGGVSRDSAAKLLDAGASKLVVGSALWRAPDLEKEYKAFCELAQTRGLYT